jgi:hypothetical protein
MRLTRSLQLLALAGALLYKLASTAQVVVPTVRILNPVNESNLVTLRGNTHPLAKVKNDRGRVSPDLPMTDLILVLGRAPEKQAAFDKMVTSQYDPDSPNFHHWLTPEQVGADFGPSDTDIATISNWLTGHGFSIDQVTKDRMSIRFSGKAAQVETAFHTEIHNLEVKGALHIGNTSDPMIPAAVAQAVVGVKSLHNFFARPQHRLGSKVIRESSTGKWQRITSISTNSDVSSAAKRKGAQPEFGISVPTNGSSPAYLVEDVTPYDFAAIYNILPLWNASTPIDGTGQTITIAGTSAINAGINVSGANGQDDIGTFRRTFGLPAYTAGQFTMISGNSQPLTVCTDPGTGDNPPACTVNDLMENSLDVEWAGSIAKGANIVLVASYPASATDDNLFDSSSYIINNKIASIMSVSYGQCELYNGTAGNVEYYNLWQTASSEGIAVFVSTGDGGSAECDDGGDAIGNPYSAQMGLSVSGLASTPFDTAVGGTDFNWCSLASSTECTAAPYWGSTNAVNGSSAKGYVPEIPWNDSCAGILGVQFLEAQATVYNVGGVTDAETACNFVYNNWLTIYNDTGGSSGGVDLSSYIDVAGGGGGASGCVVNDGNNVSSCDSSTTSTGAANGLIPLVHDGWPKPSWQTGISGIPNDGNRDIPDVSFFASDGFLSNSLYLICVSANGTCVTSSESGYPNITTEPQAQEVGGTSVSTATMAGVMALINQKAGAAQGSPNAELYKLAAKQTYSGCSAETVKAGSSACYFNDIDTDANGIAMPCNNGATEGDPSQTGKRSPNCTVLDSGDLVGILSGYGAGAGYDLATGLGSLNVANVVNGWPAVQGTGTTTVTVAPSQSSLNANSALNVKVTVAASTSGGATPTGTVTLSGGGYTSATETLSSGVYTFNIPANSLNSGSDVLTAAYSGDSNYVSTTGTATVTVTAATTSATFTLSATTPAAVSPGASATSTLTISSTNGYAGTVTLACSLTSSSSSNAKNPPSCSIASTTVTLSSTTASATATITLATTAATTSQLVRPQSRGNRRGWMGAGGGALLAFVLFLGVPFRRRSWLTMLGVLAVMAALGGLTGCGNFWAAPNGSTTAGTTAGSYTFTVTGTGIPAISSAPTTTFVVTVN